LPFSPRGSDPIQTAFRVTAAFSGMVFLLASLQQSQSSRYSCEVTAGSGDCRLHPAIKKQIRNATTAKSLRFIGLVPAAISSVHYPGATSPGRNVMFNKIDFPGHAGL
jgi:hypothetical protein